MNGGLISRANLSSKGGELCGDQCLMVLYSWFICPLYHLWLTRCIILTLAKFSDIAPFGLHFKTNEVTKCY